MLRPPLPDGGDDRNEVDALFRQCVFGFLPVSWIVDADEDPRRCESFKAIGEDAAGDFLFRSAQKFAEVPAPSEDDVTQDEQRPPIAEDFYCEIDGAAGTVRCCHGLPFFLAVVLDFFSDKVNDLVRLGQHGPVPTHKMLIAPPALGVVDGVTRRLALLL